MRTDNQELGHNAAANAEPIDFGFLAQQTFDDLALEREVLGLFVAQSRRVVPTMSELPARAQAEAAHLLSGSARGIGAWSAAAAAAAYEGAGEPARGDRYRDLVVAFAAVESAIDAYLARTIP